MAFVSDDQKLTDPNQAQQAQGQAQQQSSVSSQPGTGGTGTTDAGSGVVTGGASSSPGGAAASPTSQPGTGGTGGWTNIQDYISANQGPNNSSTALNSTVGDQFNKESTGIQNDLQSQKAAADKANPMDFSESGAAQAVNNYQNTGDQNILSQYHHMLSDPYTKPGAQPYAFDPQTQSYGTDLQNDQGFGTLMNGIYDKAAGGQMSQGQQTLQSQLDTNNPDLASARTNLTGQYQGLQSQAAQNPQALNDYYNQQSQAWSAGQPGLQKYFNDRAAGDKATMNQVIPLRHGSGNVINGVGAGDYQLMQDFLNGQKS